MSNAMTSLAVNKHFKSGAWTSSQRAGDYDRSTCSKTDLTHFITQQFIERLTERIAASSRVLDLGCGTGVLTKALAAMGYDVTGVDISTAMLACIQPESPGDRMTLVEGNVYDLPFDAGSFDGVTTRWVIPHFRDWPIIVREAARVLKPGGVFVFDQCSRANYELAHRAGDLDHEKFGYDHRTRGSAENFYASASVHELQLAADIAGMELLAVEPQSLFRQNAIIAAALGADGFQAYKSGVDLFYQDEGARAFMEWFERHVTPMLPLDMANGLTVVMKKPVKG
jgi:ubiquinone/menaquinone biosynthesis C-methylase UbiE